VTVNAPLKDPGQLAAAREVSTQLGQRLADATAPSLPSARLGVRIGGRDYLVDMAGIGEVVPVASIARVPWTRPWFRGLANVRGRLVGVYDLTLIDGGDALGDEQRLQLLVLGESLKVNAALLITRAFGLRYARDLEALPAADGAPWEGDRFRDSGGMVLTELKLESLLVDERFASIGI
jgi:twitching motility protein PilI